MYSILNIGRTGLNAMQTKLDSTADDLANVNTYGYKRKEIGFQELLTNEVHQSDVLKSANVGHSRINMGAKSGVSTTNFKQGIIQSSPGEFHMAIEGNGFFGVRDENGNLFLTRNGGFHIDENRMVSDDNGYALDIDFNIPLSEWGKDDVQISSNGTITQMFNSETVNLGRVILYNPQVLDSLTPMGEGRYLPSPNVVLYNSLNQGDMFGNIVQYSLEASNSDIGKSMIDLITTQKAYGLNSRVLQSTDDMMTIINNIKR